MNNFTILATIVFILLLYGFLLYSLYQIALKRFESLARLLTARNRRLFQEHKLILERIAALESKPEKTDGTKTHTGVVNNFDKSELRHVEEIKQSEIVLVDGKLVRKSALSPLK